MFHRITKGLGALTIGAAMLTAAAAQAADGPYVVSGNEHILVGITLDEAKVRAVLPEGMEPTEGITGGLNIYTSNGGEGVAAYQRSYVWVDLANFDSITGNGGRYILWLSDSAHSAKMARAGYDTEVGASTLTKDGHRVIGTTALGGEQVMKITIELSDAGCGDAVGTQNYPSLPQGAEGLVVTQYSFAGKICGASPVSVDITAPADHPLSVYKPVSVVWAAFAKDLSFSGSPLMPVKMAGN
ncbi:hypothetical protein [Minwuia sp.]|uniref:hypothetical protein n=1 Tax=Minwuia sp. TaxID=2493630 RepID=UPI003A8DE346